MGINEDLRAVFGARLRVDEPMAKHTNFRVGGPARFSVDVRTPEELAAAVRIADAASVSWFVLGGGSNTLVGDRGVDGLVIQVALRDITVAGSRVRAGAGAMTAAVARAAGDAGLSGFAWAISLPGTIGGAVRGNAGCFGGEMQDVVERVVVFDAERGSVVEWANADCGFRYRHSLFKERPACVILAVDLALASDDPVRCREAMDAILARRKKMQPHDKPSAGCLFKNVELDLTNGEARTKDGASLARLDSFSHGAWRTVVHDGQLPVGWIVDVLGLKGHRVGNAQVSDVHGNFVVNLGGATAADVLNVAEAVRARAREILGIELDLEVQRMGI